ncbi:hypothetical protein M409DRAFT_58776 [Zasmidium cellare ATCC 36951]|uniref:Uncharacterized protein n=1 Tax=Zasmidium cellare ATCC 36951 TaxID=1080233 RepID=A0A6A6C7H7_ZASCE|nr:uncharacterized protein M409DRAFT_58776 [Zasmidium cellare ATCC 36951]KAF2161689.1 hypothetical protein M409DRAFT_58776 [Zasmidium cellare ATCC 36951]
MAPVSTTSFGFTFGVAAPETVVPVETAEPAPKRRKLEDHGNTRVHERTHETRDSEPAPKTDRRPKARRRLESLEEDVQMEAETSAKDDSFLAVKRKTKARAVPKPRKQQVLSVASPPKAAEDEAPSRRPRRQAASKAIDKVSRGFVEEAGNVDKLRRGQDTMPAKRKVVRKAAETVEIERQKAVVPSQPSRNAEDGSTKDVAPVLELTKPIPDSIEHDVKKPRRGRPKRKIVPDSPTTVEALDQGNETSTVRLPLAETTTNPILPSTSPEKLPKPLDVGQPETIQQRSPLRIRSPSKARTHSKDVAQAKRKRSKFVVNKDPPADKAEPNVVGVGAGMESEDVPGISGSRSKSTGKRKAAPGKVEARATCDVDGPRAKDQPKVKPSKKGAQPERQTSGTDVTAAESHVQHAESKHRDSKRERQLVEATKGDVKRTVATPGEQLTNEEEGVDWLLENNYTSKHILTGKQTCKNVKRRPPRSVAELPDVDLDDLLSNIAAYVPQSSRPTTDKVRRRR